MKIVVAAGGRGAALVLVAVAVGSLAVGVFCGGTQAEEAELAYFRSGPEHNG